MIEDLKFTESQLICVKCGNKFLRQWGKEQFCTTCKFSTFLNYQDTAQERTPKMTDLFYCIDCDGHYLKSQLQVHESHKTTKPIHSFRTDLT